MFACTRLLKTIITIIIYDFGTHQSCFNNYIFQDKPIIQRRLLSRNWNTLIVTHKMY